MSLTIIIKVIPNSGKQKCTLDKNNQIKFYLKSKPEKGLANKELIQTISKKIGIPQADIEIISGLTSKNKKLRINKSINLENILLLLGLEIKLQQNIFSDMER